MITPALRLEVTGSSATPSGVRTRLKIYADYEGFGFDIEINAGPYHPHLSRCVIEPANRGASELDLLFAEPGRSGGGIPFLHHSGFVTITFGWQDDLCNCAKRQPLSLYAPRKKLPLPSTVQCSVRLDRGAKTVRLGPDYGHLPRPRLRAATVFDELAGEHHKVVVSRDRQGHVSIESDVSLRPGRRYLLSFDTLEGRRDLLAKPFEIVSSMLVSGQLDPWLGRVDPTATVVVGISQSARFLREVLYRHLIPSAGFATENGYLLFGAGGAGLPSNHASGMNEAEQVVSRPLVGGHADLVSVDTSTDQWSRDSGSDAMVLSSTPHGMIVPLRLPRHKNDNWFRLSPLPSISSGPTLRAIFRHRFATSPRAAIAKVHGKRVARQEILHRLLPWVTAGKKLMGLDQRSGVPPIDDCCNEVAEIRPLELRVPLATYAGWGCMADAELVELLPGIGYVEPLRRSSAHPDPWDRPALSDLYSNEARFMAQIEAECTAMCAAGELLQEDAAAIKRVHIRSYRLMFA